MKIVVADPTMIAGDVVARLEALGEVVFGPFTDADLNIALADCEALMVRLDRYVGEELLRQGPRLRYVLSATTGLDHIDLAAAAARGVRVISLRDCPQEIQRVSATAEHTWGLLLALLRKTPSAVSHALAGQWDRNQFWGWQLAGKQLGIIGHGRIGSMVARYAEAFGMSVVAHDIAPRRVVPPARLVSLEDLMRGSDVVSVHVTANDANHHLVDAALVALAKPSAFLVNTARGGIVDSAAVVAALEAGQLAGAAVDVLEGEERGAVADDPLLACARAGHNVLVTPHIGGATRESVATAESAVVSLLATLARGDDASPGAAGDLSGGSVSC